MKILDLFKNVNKDELAKEIVTRFPDYFSKDGDKDHYTAIEAVSLVLDDIFSITPINLNDKEFEEYKDFVVLVREWIDDGLYDGKEISEYPDDFDFKHIDINKLNRYFGVDGIHLSDLKKNVKSLDYTFEERKQTDINSLVTSYGIDFIPRRILLNLDVPDFLINKYSLNIVAAEIFWEMTFYGFLEEDVQKKSDEVLETAKEAEEHPENLKEFNMEDFFPDTTPEEKAAFKRDVDFGLKFSNALRPLFVKEENLFYKEVYNFYFSKEIEEER